MEWAWRRAPSALAIKAVIYVVGLAIGYLLWTGLETIIHRLGHARWRTHILAEHRAHHVKPDYFTPLRQKLPAIGPLVIAIGAGFAWWGGTVFGACVASGVFGGWLHYEWLHPNDSSSRSANGVRSLGQAASSPPPFYKPSGEQRRHDAAVGLRTSYPRDGEQNRRPDALRTALSVAI